MPTTSATYKGTTYTNGNVPSRFLNPLDGTRGAFLREDAADAYNRARAEAIREKNVMLSVRGWNRSLAEQVRFFFERYRRQDSGTGPFGDVRWYNGRRYVRFTGAAAAIPGQSNHGLGLAIDVSDFGGVGNFSAPKRVATIEILKKHGWTETEGRGRIQEPWHLVYNPALDRGRNPVAPPKRNPARMPTLKLGSRGVTVDLLQRRLGIDHDGDFGNDTKRAVIRHQRQAGLADDGVVGNRTWLSLIVGTLEKGDRGTKVEILQLIVVVKRDGDFGNATESAVKAVQRALGLTADGKAGNDFRAGVLKFWNK
jgi:peptidoglycan hydrolase-like protein with peptidoglycan-binding domain